MTSLRKEIERVMNLKGEKEKILYVRLALNILYPLRVYEDSYLNILLRVYEDSYLNILYPLRVYEDSSLNDSNTAGRE